MFRKSHRSKGDSAYRIKRAKSKKPIRFLETGILILLFIVVAYVASFTIQITNGYSREKEPTQYYINLQVLNGCGNKGLAEQLADRIEMTAKKPLAVRVVDADNFDNFQVEKTFVISRVQPATAAEMLAQQLGITTPVTYSPIDDNYRSIGATLVLGKDYKTILGIK